MRGKKSAWREVTGIVLLDKPLGLSSNQALQQVRRLFSAAKAGHTGSLDPMATGMLPICFGHATKLCGFLLDADKRYLASVQLGERTATGDAEGEVVERSDPAGLTREDLERVLPQFRGPILQIPPMHSALKHEGRRLYELARAGEEIERAPREVTIHDLRLTAFDGAHFEIDVRCSKGTYIRTLAEDIARAAGQCAHLSALRRLEVTPFSDLPMWTLPALEEAALAAGEAGLDRLLIRPAVALRHWPQLTIDAARARFLAQGQAVRVAGLAQPQEGPGVAVLDEGGELLGIAAVDAAGMLAPRRWLAAVQ